MALEPTDLADLKMAKDLLETPGLAARITHILGKPIETGFELLPQKLSDGIGRITEKALTSAMQSAVLTMKDLPGKTKSNAWHKLAVAATGGAGGFFGLAAMAVELPVSTTIMLRSIADVARSQGESISQPDARLACIEVFALGGPGKGDDAAESGYFAVRAALARSVTEAVEYVAQKGIVEEGAPVLVRLIVQVAERFSIQVTEKAAAQAIPALGAAGGALINTVFIDHFQDMAHGHFIVRRLERKYGPDAVKRAYLAI